MTLWIYIEKTGEGAWIVTCPRCGASGDFYDTDERATHARVACGACGLRAARDPAGAWVAAGTGGFWMPCLDSYALVDACMEGDVGTALTLLATAEGRATAAAGENLALRCAVAYGCPTIVAALLRLPDVRARKGACGDEARRLAAENGYGDILELLERA